MKDISFFANIYFCLNPVDFRKQANGLTQLVQGCFGKSLNGHKCLFVFRNKGAKAVKLLYWDGTGIALWSKKLEKDSFKWPKKSDEPLKLTASELKNLLQGIDIINLNKHKPHNFRETA